MATRNWALAKDGVSFMVGFFFHPLMYRTEAIFIHQLLEHITCSLDQMRKFRRQHEQLRNVIIRVLKPQGSFVGRSQLQPSLSLGLDENKVDYQLDAADENAIEEVNLAYKNVKEVDVLDISKEGQKSSHHLDSLKWIKN
ncbi:unnamed protein product [Clavelina lepadiformis]|uniref:Uncharacterized protein n=1 Tax=Clavelina lepadiformis TaxID=159417 RepID=A0ABP0FBJ0_CLALP